MSILSISNLSKAYKASPLFKNINLQVQSGEKIALVGDNGSGKSTLLKLIAGLEDADSGTIKLSNSTLMAYLSQHMQEFTDLDRPVLSDRLQDEYESKLHEISTDIASLSVVEQEQLLSEYQHISDKFERRGGYSYLPKLTQALNALGIRGEILNRPIRTLSGGERMRVLLAEKLLENADLLLLDEPTNHLDIEGLEWLENFIKNYKGAVIVVSHDRYFIDQFADRTCELSSHTLTSYQGNYSDFIKQKQERLDIQSKTLENLEKEHERQENITSTLLSHRKISSYHSREKIVQKLGEAIEEIRSKIPEKSKNMNFSFLPIDYDRDENRLIIKTENLSFSWNDTAANEILFENFNLKLKATEKKVLLGPNGAGKSTLLNILMGINTNYQGKVEIASDIKFAHLGQFVEFPDENLTILEEIQERTLMLETEARTLLAKYGFFSNEVFKQIKVLSGGEKSRLYLACIILENPDLLYLDEPTNHLDIHSREILESAINDFNGAVLAVSHDRYFIKKCGLDILGFIGTEIKEFSTYESYKHFSNIYRNTNKDNSIAEPIKIADNKISKLDTKKQLQELRKQKNKLEKELKILADDISTLESDLNSRMHEMAGESMDQYLEYAELNEKLDSQSEKYFTLGEELEDIEKKIAEVK